MATWIVVIEWLARLILFGLIGLSVWSISIIIERRRYYKQYTEQDQNSQLFDWIEKSQNQTLKDWASKNQGLRAGTIKTILFKENSKSSELLEKAVSSYWARERLNLEKGLPILGTLGSTTPFVGLLGTILGIIVAFGALSTGMIDSQKVMYSLAEALTLTAVGLAVAIPAVIAFNTFSRKLITLFREGEAIRDALIAQVVEK